MKKSYLMIAAAASLFVACAETDTINEIDTIESAISFNPFTENVTRSAIVGVTGTSSVTGTSTLAQEGGFVVYGYKKLNNVKQNPDIFAGKNVYYDGTNSVWKYDGLRFWDRNATYDFFAVAPNNPESGVSYSIDNDPTDDATNTTTKYGQITITGAKSHKYSASDDYLIDRDGNKGVLGSAHTSSNNPNVDIDFHHVMAKIDFKLKSTLSSGKITVTELKMSGWDNATATFKQNMEYTGAPSTLVTDEWTRGTADAGDVTLVGTGAGDASVELTCSPTATATALTDWYIMVPQQIAYTAPSTGLTFTVTYTYSDNAAQNPYEETFTDQVAVIPSTQTWGTDSHTTYTLDIKPAEIKFNVTQICGFHLDANQDVTVQ